jgi:predicted RNA-binding protein YlxR (DUF448 family)
MAAAKIAPSDTEERSRKNSVAENTRQCVVCRIELPPAELLALGFIGQQLVYERVGGQRGAYVCPTKACLSKLSTAHVSRAFRRSVKTDGLGELVEAAHALSGRRLAEALGLCRRQGVVQVGVDALRGENPRGAVRIIASDLSQNSAGQIREASVFRTSEELGQYLGMKRVGALSISPGPMANRVAFWLRLWQETFDGGQSDAK